MCKLVGTLAVLAAVAAALVSARAHASTQAPNQDVASAALLAKHRAYIGWQFGDGTFRTMRITGDVTNEKGEKTQSFVYLSSGLVYHNRYTMLQHGNITEHTGFTGNIFWASDINGFTTPVYGDYAKYLASFTILLQEGTTELPASFVADKMVDGKTVAMVRVTLTNGDPIDLYVDRDSGAYVQATIDPDGPYETKIHILSYRDVTPGKKMMASYRLGDDKDVHTYESFEPNVSVSDEELHPPGAAASWTFAGQSPVSISLTRYRILVDATVNGVKGRFILDTGADAIYLDDRYADRASAPLLKGSGEAGTMSGAVKTRVRRVEALAVGDATLHNVLVYSHDFRENDYRGLDWQGYDGLIGYDLFAGAIVKLDVYASRMTILDPATDLSTLRGLPLVVDLSNGTPAIPMTLNKSIAVNATLDTGSPGVVFMKPEVAKKHNLPEWNRGCGNLESLSIGPITYAGQAVCVAYFPSASDMLLGFDFLKHFDYVFDYPHGRIFLTPNKN